MLLNADKILSHVTLKRVKLDIPEWGGHVFVSEMNGTAKDQYENSLMEKIGAEYVVSQKNLRAKLVVYSVTDSNGLRLFTDDQIPDVGKMSSSILDRIIEKSKEVGNISHQEEEEITKKNSDTSQEDGSTLP